MSNKYYPITKNASVTLVDGKGKETGTQYYRFDIEWQEGDNPIKITTFANFNDIGPAMLAEKYKKLAEEREF